MKNIISLLTLTILLLLPIKVSALDENYIITGYDIDVKVNHDNSYYITEKITVYFNNDRHGIFRDIPTKNTVTRLDGSTSINNALVSKIKVSDTYVKESSGSYITLKIGDPNKTIIGVKEYTISYLYNIGKDKSKGFDEFYFNLIGNGWQTTIENVTFKITMPKEFDKEKLGFSNGSIGSSTNNVTYEVNGNVITGDLNTILLPSEALTIRLEMEDNYYTYKNPLEDPFTYLTILLPLLFLFISYNLWKVHGKDDEVFETVEFYPPEGYNSAEVGFLYKGHANTKDVISLLIYLANKGYIKIVEEGEDDFKFIKLKEYDGNNLEEKMFFNGLFEGKKDISVTDFMSLIKNPSKLLESNKKVALNEVDKSDLENSFYITLNSVKSKLNRKENKAKIYESSSEAKTPLIILMIIATFILTLIKPLYEFSGIDSFLVVVGLFFASGGFISYKSIVTYSSNGLFSKIGGIIALLFGCVPLFFIVLPVLLFEVIYLYIFIIGLICIIGMVIFASYMSKRNKYGTMLLGKLEGFKNFLETVEKEKLESLVLKNPTYFYDILPYTYVFGISEKWVSKFETIGINEPTWYSGNGAFNAMAFSHFMNDTMTTVENTMASSPSSSSSGGGFSGGGSGGGGGGSW